MPWLERTGRVIPEPGSTLRWGHFETMSAKETPPAAPGATPVSLKAGLVRWRVRSAEIAAEIRGLLDAPEEAMQRSDTVIHETGVITIVRVPLPVAVGGRALLRSNNYGKHRVRMRDFFRISGSLRAFRNAFSLERAGIPTPRILAAGIQRSFHVPRAGYLLMDEVSPAMTLAELAKRPACIPPGVIRGLAEEIANMHGKGFIHGDLSINNVLMDENLRPWFIDLERARRTSGSASWKNAADEFHRLARHVGKFRPCMRFAALRMLVQYCRLRGWAGREREFAEAVQRQLAKKVRAK